MKRKTALILIDIQEGFSDLEYWGGRRNNENAENHSAAILKFWRSKNWPIYHVKHNSTDPGSPLFPGKIGNAIQQIVKPLPSEEIFTKTVNSAFIGTRLEEELKDKKIDSVVIVGLTTDHCISTSVRMSANLGFKTILIEDATATFPRINRHGISFSAEEIQAVTIATLDGEFSNIMTTSELLSMFKNS